MCTTCDPATAAGAGSCQHFKPHKLCAIAALCSGAFSPGQQVCAWSVQRLMQLQLLRYSAAGSSWRQRWPSRSCRCRALHHSSAVWTPEHAQRPPLRCKKQSSGCTVLQRSTTKAWTLRVFLPLLCSYAVAAYASRKGQLGLQQSTTHPEMQRTDHVARRLQSRGGFSAAAAAAAGADPRSATSLAAAGRSAGHAGCAQAA